MHIKSGDFHHGYLLVGDFEISRKMALEAARTLLGYTIAKLKSHPDFFEKKFELFSIKDSLELRYKASMKPFIGKKKVFVVEISYFSIEAANALLKTFEEPAEGTHFFIITSSVENLLPTLRSRLTIVDFSVKPKLDKEKYDSYEKFLKALPSKRLETIKKLLTKDFSQNKKTAIEFLNGLEVVVASQFEPKTDVGSATDARLRLSALEEIQKNREFLFDRAPSIKIILEHIALTLPKM